MKAKSQKTFAAMCALLMTVMIFQNVSADEFNTGEDMDIFIDSFGNEHQVWRELVNGTYQVFYGYQIEDMIYTANTITYANQNINTNINFNDGYLTIQNSQVNGNIKITQGNVLLQDCNISGNVEIDLGRIQIINCIINGNLETKNANLEMRYTHLNGNVNAKLSSYEDFSVIITGNDINGNVKIKGGTCYFVGNIINGNLNVDDPTIIQLVSDNDVNGNIKLNNNMAGFDGYQITNSTMDVLYPQCAVDPITSLGYVLWLENGSDLYYIGTDDFVIWNEPQCIGSITAIGNPELNLAVSNGLLTVIWKNDGILTLRSDIDGDFIPDVEDALPIEYNIAPGDSSFIPDAISIDIGLGISVAIDYLDNATVKPSISSAIIPPAYGSIGIYVNISTVCNQTFTAIVKCKYDDNLLPEYTVEKYIRAYRYINDSWTIVKNASVGEDTGVDEVNNFAWFRTLDFSTFTFLDSSLIDSDNDVLTDAEEIGADGCPPVIEINSFSDGTTSKTISMLKDQDYVTYINVPIYDAEIERFNSASISIGSNSYAFSDEHQLTSSTSYCGGPNVYEDIVVYTDTRYGNQDIFLYDTTNEIETQLSFSSQWDGSPKIWGDYVLWYRSYGYASIYSDVILKNYITGEELIFYGGVGDLNGNYIIYPDDSGIMLYNIVTDTSYSIPNSQSRNSCIYGDYVAYISPSCDNINLYSISQNYQESILPTGQNPFLIDIGDRYVVYFDMSTNDLYTYDIIKKEIKQITYNPGSVNEPTVCGSIILWTEYRNTLPGQINPNVDIYGYDLENNIEFPVCLSEGQQCNPSMYGDTIVWTSFKDDNTAQIVMSKRVMPELSMHIGDNIAWNVNIMQQSFSSPDFSTVLNKYLMDHSDLDDGIADGKIKVPISFSTNVNEQITFSNLNADMYMAETDPVDPDTDHDLLDDGYEVLTNSLRTSPINPDCDNDGLRDGVESASGIQWFEAETFQSPISTIIEIDPDASNGLAIYSTIDDSATISCINKVTVGTYDIMFRAKTNDPTGDYKGVWIFCDLNGDNLYHDIEVHFDLTTEYRWYIAYSITFTSNINQIHIGDNWKPINYIDKVAIIPSNLNNGQATDPLDSDTDRDGLTDGQEVVAGAYWFEGEGYPAGPVGDTQQTRLVLDRDASNGKALYTTVDDSSTIYIQNKVKIGTYDISFRARSLNPTDLWVGEWIFCDLNGDGTYHDAEVHFDLTTEYRWYTAYELTFTSDTNIICIGNHWKPTNYIDQIAIIPHQLNNGQITDPLNPDTDKDGLKDSLEVVAGAYWYEAEAYAAGLGSTTFIQPDREASNGKSLYTTIDDSSTVNLQNKVTAGTYDITFRAKSANPTDTWVGEWIFCDLNGDGSYHDAEIHFDLTAEYRWYTAYGLTFTSDTNIICIGNHWKPTNYIDKIGIIPSVKNNGQNTDPLDPDTERDGLKDGQEVVAGAYWYEAEAYAAGLGSTTFIQPDREASNGKSLYTTIDDSSTVILQNKVKAGIYDITFRAKTDDPTGDYKGVWIFCDLNGDGAYHDPGTDVHFDLTTEYRWYTAYGLTFTSDTNIICIGNHWKPTNYIDKIGIIPSNLNNGQVTDPLDPDTDRDGVKDGTEINGFIGPGFTNAGTTYHFTYHTNPMEPDTDFDGQNDATDPIPTDYDMDGDGYINHLSLIDSISPYYSERIALAIQGYLLNLNRNPTTGALIQDYDMDNDGKEFNPFYLFIDLDKDNDGMENSYEQNYGVAIGGWQNPYVHNERYAVLLGGEDDFDANENDFFEMFDKLKDYSWEDANIYAYLWDKDNNYDSRVDGQETRINIEWAIFNVGIKITKNDFFFFCEIGHARELPTENEGNFVIYDPGPGGDTVRFSTNPYNTYKTLKELLDNSITNKCARSLIIAQSCWSGWAVESLIAPNRIVISGCEKEGYTHTDVGDFKQHWAFISRSTSVLVIPAPPFILYIPHTGFIGSLGIIDTPYSIEEAFIKGWISATSNIIFDIPQYSYPQISNIGLAGDTYI